MSLIVMESIQINKWSLLPGYQSNLRNYSYCSGISSISEINHIAIKSVQYKKWSLLLWNQFNLGYDPYCHGINQIKKLSLLP